MTLHVLRRSSLLLFAVAMAGGCNQADLDRWNSQWGNGGKDATVRTAGADGPAAAPAEGDTGATPEDPGNVQRNVDDYVASMAPRDEPAATNDHVSKIKRNQVRSTGEQPEADSDPESLAWRDTGGSDTAAFRAEMARREAERRRAADAGQNAEAGDAAPASAPPATADVSEADDADATDDAAADAEMDEEIEGDASPVRVASGDPEPVDPAARDPIDLSPPRSTRAGEASPDASGRISANAGGASVEPTSAGSSADGAPEVADIIIKPAQPQPAAEAGVQNNAASPAADRPAAAAAADSVESRIRRHEALVAADPNNIEEQFRLRLLYLVEGLDDKALAPVAGVDEDVEEIILSQVRSLIAARSGAGRDPATWANRQLESIEELRRRVRARADLQVPVVQLCTAVDGFGRYKPIEVLEFPAGVATLVIIYIEVDNFSSTLLPSGQFRTLLAVRESLINRSGEELWSAKEDNIEDVSRQQREDFFITSKRGIPSDLPPGEYTLKVEVEDVLAGKLNSNSVKFKIVP